MNRLRVFLLVLLMLMLPVRGVMAAAMLCPPAAEAGGAGSAHENLHTEAGHHTAGHHTGGHLTAAHLTAGHHADAASHHPAGGAGADTCNLCSACCSTPPLAATAPALPMPQAMPAMAFPPLAVPVPSFLAGGPERPPRSL